MPSIRPITIDETENLGIDDQGQLYWKNQPVMTRQTVKLEAWLNVAVVVGAFAALVQAAVEVLRFASAR